MVPPIFKKVSPIGHLPKLQRAKKPRPVKDITKRRSTDKKH